MTICNKIQKVGETMETNLNARGVSCTFGTGTGESTVLDMVEMVNGTNFKGSSDVNLKIGANRPYLLTGETTDVVVKLENGLCEPLKNKNVTIEQSLFRDNGTTTSHNDIWYLSNATLTRNASDSTLLETTATGYAMSDQYNKIPPNSVVEFDICQTDGTSNYAPIYIRNDGGGVSLSNINYNNLGASIGDWVHIKIVFNNTNTITVYSDKLSEPFTKTLSATSTNYRVMLYCGGDMTTIKFKNYVVYENITGVTDEKGEFALYNVSVTGDTIFTATYGTETASCLVEYCQFVDYGTSTKHNDNWVNNNSNMIVTRNDMYTTLTPTVNNSQNRYDVPTVPNQPFVIEFDKHNTSVSGSYILIGNNAIQFSSSFNGNLATAKHLKFTIQDNKVTCEHDGVVEQIQLNITSLTYIRFQINNTNEGNIIQYNNFRIR